MQKDKLEKLASERSNPCVTISMNTPHGNPNNLQDIIEFRELQKVAHNHVVDEFGQHPVSNLLWKIDNLEHEIDFRYNLSSIHFFLSDSTSEIVKSSWPTLQNVVSVAESFVIKPLIKDFNRTEEYLILALSQTDVRLLRATNDTISGEIPVDDFPFDQNPHFLADQEKSGNSKQSDNFIREFFNNIDKAVLKIHHKTGMNVVVICTDNNWSKLLQVADQPSVYYGNVSLNSSDTANQSIAAEAFQIVNRIQEESRAKAIQEMKEAAGHGKTITNLLDIYNAVKSGRGDLLIMHDDYHQSVKMDGQYSFHLVDDVTLPGVIDDITSDIAWEVISKKGRVLFTNQEEFNTFGNIALKVRY
ncbi:MAG: hypothetical protein WC384_17200 [Prolixibacteraceae bacterium]|jgi:hypothetical protein